MTFSESGPLQAITGGTFRNAINFSVPSTITCRRQINISGTLTLSGMTGTLQTDRARLNYKAFLTGDGRISRSIMDQILLDTPQFPMTQLYYAEQLTTSIAGAQAPTGSSTYPLVAGVIGPRATYTGTTCP